MPTRAPRPCRAPGCPELVSGKGSLCPAHAKRETAAYNARRGTPAERGYGVTWRRLRKRFLEAFPFCADPYGVHDVHARASVVDHIISKREGGPDAWSNLQSLCKSCHDRKTALEDGRWGRQR